MGLKLEYLVFTFGLSDSWWDFFLRANFILVAQILANRHKPYLQVYIPTKQASASEWCIPHVLATIKSIGICTNVRSDEIMCIYFLYNCNGLFHNHYTEKWKSLLVTQNWKCHLLDLSCFPSWLQTAECTFLHLLIIRTSTSKN